MMWLPILLTSAGTWLQKYLGHLLPESWTEGERISRVLALLPIGLLAAPDRGIHFHHRVTGDRRRPGRRTTGSHRSAAAARPIPAGAGRCGRDCRRTSVSRPRGLTQGRLRHDAYGH